jgi:DNA-binding transcriptional LysR family regulator
MDKIDSLQLFCRIADLGSYSEVARERHISRSGVSRAITQLEQRFGIQLFKRSTRSLALTDAGRELYAEAERLLRQFETMEDRMCRDRSEVKGLLRVAVPGPLSERYILPDLEQFHQRFPQIKLFLQVSENLSDLYRDELDMTIRMGSLPDSSFMAVQLSTLSLTMAASPDFIKKHAPITHPQQLKDLNCLCFRGRGRGTNWHFKKDNLHESTPVNGFLTADCGYTLRAMAVAGHGIVAMPTPLIKEELEKGELIPVMPEWQLDVNDSPWGIHLLYHADRQQLNRVRVFIDYMKEPERLIHRCDDISVKN